MPTPPGNINAKNEHGNTELLRACIADTRGNLTYTIIELLGRGANPNIADSAGYTPLHYAVMKGNLNAVQALLQKGANRDAASISGSTPRNLSARAHFFNREIFRALGAQDDHVGGKRHSRTNKKTRKTSKKRHTVRRRR
jgi:ankyrin repeat protein